MAGVEKQAPAVAAGRNEKFHSPPPSPWRHASGSGQPPEINLPHDLRDGIIRAFPSLEAEPERRCPSVA